MNLEKNTLLIDADDTLWENNIYFQEAMQRFLGLMEGLGFPPEAVQAALNDLERQNIKLRGYGSKKFIISMQEAFRLHCDQGDMHCSVSRIGQNGTYGEARVLAQAISAVCQAHCGENALTCLVDRIEQFGGTIAGRPMQLLDGVEEALRQLALRNRLILFTKGDRAEQMDKVVRSGLSPYFHAVEVAREKNREAYLGLVIKYNLDKASTWMIGNSPRSDINPSTLVGLRAVFIPHTCTWELEEEPIALPERVTVLRAFRDLTTLF